ncbi:MAG: mechanosensitive ion channel family protein [Oscillospiraceae bacterium]|nr:mechanosensitive ion channel family protein [Oscillospiraceae bacterium]
MNRTKHIVKLLIFVAAVGLLLVLGAGRGLELGKSWSQTWASLGWAGVGRILLVIFGVLALEHLILLILGFIKTENHRARTVMTLTANLIRYIAILVIVIGVLSLLNVDVPTVLAGLGIIALIIGFGAESLITDVVTGFFILMDNQYNVGDIIEVGGFRGTVSEIGIRTTSLTDTGGNVKIINNSDMKNILNRSDNSSKAVTDFSIPYETDIEKLEEKIPALLEEILQKHPELFKSRPVYLGVQALSSSSVDLRFVAEVGESDIYSGARVLNHDLFVGFRRLGVECPFPQVDVHSK